jgi:hypothetical protein
LVTNSARRADLRPAEDAVWASLLGGLACVVITVALASDRLGTDGAAAIGAAIFLLAAIWCLFERRLGRSLVFFGLYLGIADGYLKLKTGNREMTLARDLLLWAIAAGAFWRTARRGEPLRVPPLSLFVLAFAFVTLIQVANPSAPGIVQSLGGVRQHLEFVPLFFLGYSVLRTRRSLVVLLVAVVAIAAANGLVSYWQSTLTPDELARWGKGYSERIYGTGIFVGQGKVSADVVDGAIRGVHVRPFGLGSEIGAGAVIAALALPALLALILSGRRRLRTFALICAPATALAIVTSGSRAALVACLASMLAFLFLAGAPRDARKLVAGAALLLALVAVAFSVLGASNDTARRAKSLVSTDVLSTYWDERGPSVRKVGDYLEDHPLGLGVGTVGPAAHVISGSPGELNTETEWNLIVLEAGVAGLLVLVLFGGRLIYLSATRIRRRTDDELRLLLAAIAAPLAALLVLCFAGPTSVSAPTSPFFWLTAGALSYWLLGPGSGDDGREPEAA